MGVGKLRYPITLERPISKQDEMGGVVRAWETVSREWADLENISGSEFVAAQALQSQSVHKITIRYRADLVSAWRLREGTSIYEITAVLSNGRRSHLEVVCKLGTK